MSSSHTSSAQQHYDCLDGCGAAAHVAYACSDNAVIYPITPSTPMGAFVDQWSSEGRKNVFDQVLSVTQMQSEGGAAGAVHGSLAAGALTTTFTASQGLLLMLPNMYKIAGEKLPAVFHIAARAIAGQALSIFGDHSDVMACRQTGFTFLNSATVQECMDLALVAHMASLEAMMPFAHFFDGFRTSHEIQKIKVIDYPTIKRLLNFENIKQFRANSLNPEHPQMRGTSQGPDIYFQLMEAANIVYNRIPGIVQDCMNKVAKEIGRQYHIFDYVGHPQATHVVVVMGSGASMMEEVANHINAKGGKVGVVKVRLYRPWCPESFFASLPATVTHICVLDRTKEHGSFGEPLYTDVCSTMHAKGDTRVVIGGRFGLGSKDFTGAHGKAVFDNLASPNRKNHFTVGINDDLTHTSIPVHEMIDSVPRGTVQCLFWGLGSDGTVGANKEAIKLIGMNTDLFCQGYFEYDAKKSYGLTRSHLRFGPHPINASYNVNRADFVACHNPSYVGHYHLLRAAREGGVFALNCKWSTEEELEKHLSGDVKRDLALKKMRMFVIDAIRIAEESGLGQYINMIMQTVFLKLANVIPIDRAIELLKHSVVKMYSRKGDEVVQKNLSAIDNTLTALKEIPIPARWAECEAPPPFRIPGAPEFVNEVMLPCGHYQGDDLPVSTLARLCPGGVMPTATSRYEKRGFAANVSHWITEKCIQCNSCAFNCPHAVIRPFLLTEEEAAKVPNSSYKMKKATGKGLENYYFTIQISPLDCTGCSVCAKVCPTQALSMEPIESQSIHVENWEYSMTLPIRDAILSTASQVPNPKASQFHRPFLEFSGACGGCGETPYVKLVTQLFGDRMLIANATGCTSIWGASAPWCPYCVDDEGHGPAWGNSLFEDGAEYGYGMLLATTQRRQRLLDIAHRVAASGEEQTPASASTSASSATGAAAQLPPNVRDAARRWLESADDPVKSRETGNCLKAALEPVKGQSTDAMELWEGHDLFRKKSQWIIGGDGWAYDIGFGGLDHVLSCNDNINVLVLDTEVYSNTGGQRSKATPRGASAQFAMSGKKTPKKNLGMMFMSYGYVFVAQISLGANAAHCLRAIQEAEAYPGPSIIICYAPCINHGIKGGMGNQVDQQKAAVKHGYWPLYTYNPLKAKDGGNPFTLASPEPSGDLKQFMEKEIRFDSLARLYRDEAERLHTLLAEDKKKEYHDYKAMADVGKKEKEKEMEKEKEKEKAGKAEK